MRAPPLKLRVAIWVLVLVALSAWLAIDRWERGHAPSGVLTSSADLGEGVRLDRRDDLGVAPLIICKIPRPLAPRIQATLANSSFGSLKPLTVITQLHEAVVAINGDYHRLSGSFCYDTPYSTFVDEGRAYVIGAPGGGIPTSFWIDGQGVPRIGPLDLGAKIRIDGQDFAANKNVEDGDVVLVDRPNGRWSPGPEMVGTPIQMTSDDSWLRATCDVQSAFYGPALIVRRESRAYRALTKPGTTIPPRAESLETAAPRVRMAIGTGPKLVERSDVTRVVVDEKSQGGWTNRLARTAVGFDVNFIYFATTIQEPHGGLSMLELAQAMKKLGCTDALNLDGGPSTTMWARGLGVVNMRFDGDATPVASALLLRMSR